MTVTNTLPTPFPVARYCFEFSVEASIRLPEYAGSALRGAFGQALRRIVCMTKQKACAPCPLRRSCPFTAIFAPPSPVGGHALQDFSQIPVPFVVEPPAWGERVYAPGESLQFHLILVGRALEQLPLVVHAWQRALGKGLGRGDGTASLRRVSLVDAENERDVYDIADGRIEPHGACIDLPDHATETDTITLRLETPMRLQKNGAPIRPRDICVRDLLVHLMRRVALMSEFHVGHRLDWDFHGMADAAARVESEKELAWRDWKRYSSRQKQEMTLGGVLGEWTLRGQLWPFVPMLRLGQWLHVGKNASFGLGRYRMDG